MTPSQNRKALALWFIVAAQVIPLPAFAEIVINDTLTGATSTYSWTTTGGACLTAGDGSTSTIPACQGLPYYSGKTQVGGTTGRLPDLPGKGALRLTNGDFKAGGNGNSNTGSVISTTPFPTSSGVHVTYTTATYGGNAYKNSSGIPSGADGIAFFLLDGTKTPSIGAYGGSLGYSCSQNKNPADGVNGGYLAVAIDEYGNFSNSGDATADGPSPNPGAIVVRGSGSVNFTALNAAYPTYYPTALSDSDKNKAVQNTCRTGFIQNWSGTGTKKNPSPDLGSTAIPVADYKMLTSPLLVTGDIYNQEAIDMPRRGNANIFTYDLSITQDGLLSLGYSVNGGSTQSVIQKQSITAGNGPLPPSFLFGFTSGTGGGSNVHEILCFKAAQIDGSSDSAGTNVQQSAKVQAGSQVYFAYYHPLNSWGELHASSLTADATTGAVSISSTANWDANCVLTGGACAATGGATTTAQLPSSRVVLSWDGTKGVPFKYADLSSSEQTALGTTSSDSSRIDYLRGDRTKEIPLSGPGGTYRRRDGVLGDIRNSSPIWVGYPSTNYGGTGTGTDLFASPTKTINELGAAYSTFATNNATRINVVFVGANDGMLHGFRAGSYDSSKAFVSTNNDGAEVLSYVPAAVVNSIHSSTSSQDFSSTNYGHNAYVDATPGTGDLYYNGAWHTWLVGGLGAGGNSGGPINDSITTAVGDFFAIDITDPSKFLDANAATVVIGEWNSQSSSGGNSSSISCTNVANCNANLGSVYGTPIIRRLHDGNWAVIFGNGRNSAAGTAGVFIMKVDYTTGARSFLYLDTGSGSALAKNGIDFVSSADLDDDHVTDYLYAGDYNGNLWRFDLTSSNPSSWAAGVTPLFTTATGQPISTRITVNSVAQVSGPDRIVLGFGTGQQFPQTPSSGTTYASGAQALYGIWDWNLTGWNGKSKVKYVALASPQLYTTADLQLQTLTTFTATSGDIAGYRTVSQNVVCWKGSTSCGTGNTQFGWKLLFTGSEQIIYNPVVAYNAIFFNTTIPASPQPLSCTTESPSGFTMAISPGSGGALTESFFDTAAIAAGFITNPSTAGSIVSGLGLSATGSPSFVTSTTGTGSNSKSITTMISQTVKGQPKAQNIDVRPRKAGRLTWVKLR